MHTRVTAVACAVALAGAFGVASASQRKPPTPRTTHPTDRADRTTTTKTGCLERNAYDQYVLVPSGQPSSTGDRAQYELLLQKDLDLTSEVGKRVQVTGHVLEGREARTDLGNVADRPVGTTGSADANTQVFGVVAAQPTSGTCAPQASQR